MIVFALTHLDVMTPEASTASFGMAETILFYCTAVFMVACAIGMGLAKQAAHSAILMVGVMLGLAVLYFSQDALFLATVQVVVYTGAIMILFLFVLMLVGVAASDNYQKTSAGLRWSAWVLGGLGSAILVTALISANLPETGGIAYDDSFTNPVVVAIEIFSKHIFTMEITGALLVLAALGAVTLTHSDVLSTVMKQPETADAKMQAYAATGRHPGQLPSPGVYASTNAPNVAAISGIDGSPIQESVPRVVRAQGGERPIGQAAQTAVLRVQADRGDNPEKGMHSLEASRAVQQSGAWGMPGARVDNELSQPETRVVKVQALEAGQSTQPAVLHGPDDETESEADPHVGDSSEVQADEKKEEKQ